MTPSQKILREDMTMTADQAKATIMPFGMHKGHTLEHIAEEDPQYIDWLTDATTDPVLSEAIKIVARVYSREIEAAIEDRSWDGPNTGDGDE